MTNYKNYKVWEKSHHLVLDIYAITKNFHLPNYIILFHK